MMDGGSYSKKSEPSKDYGPRKRNRMVVELRPRPNHYVPRTGPPLQPIGLLLSDDSTAYIQDRIILPSPGLAKDGKPLPKQMTYLLGWTDMPAASLLVSAMEVLDYVSPLVLEQWEYNMEMELEKEKEKLQKEKQEAEQGQAQVHTKKQGRPPVHSQIESAAIAEPEDEAQAKSRISKGAMTLSTPPKKCSTEDVEMWYEEEEEEDEEQDSPSRLLIEETAAALAQEMGLDDEYGLEADEMECTPLNGASRNSEGTESTSGPDSRPRSISGGGTPPSRPGQAAGAQSNPARKAQTPRNKQVPNGQVKITSFLSANKATYKRPPSPVHAVPTETPVPVPAYASARPKQPTTKAKPKPGPKKPRRTASAKPPAPAQDPEQEWEIKRLEGMRVYEVEGNGAVRYFKVRWEGHWPPEQNPTWEPEDHLPPAAVRNWLKMPKKRQRFAASEKGRAPGRRPAVKPPESKTYRSVSKAFMGGEDEGAELTNQMAIDKGEDEDVRMDTGWDNDNDGTKDELLVVADGARDNSASKRSLFRTGFGLFSAFR